jgi:hypothetical protein
MDFVCEPIGGQLADGLLLISEVDLWPIGLTIAYLVSR